MRKICESYPVLGGRNGWFLLGLVALSLAGCREHPSDGQPKEAKKSKADVELGPKALEAAKLSVGKPTRARRRSSVSAVGTVDFVPSHVARIGSQLGGRIAQLLVTPGQDVARGATVATIDSADLGRARADLATAQSKLRQTGAEVAREESLFSGGASSERVLLAVRTERSVAQAEVHAAEDRLRAFGATSGGSASLSLVTPLAGKVLEVRARVGQPVSVTDTLVVVGSTDQVWLGVDVYERDLAKVHLGDEARVTAIAYPKRVFVGKVDHLGAVIDRERRVLEARIVLANADSALRPGMTATARILGGDEASAATVLTVPKGAIQAIDGLPYVFVEVERGKYDLRAIERGSDIEDAVEALRGLSGDETIVTEGTFILKSEVLREQMGAND